MNDCYNHIYFLELRDTSQGLSSINYKKVKARWEVKEKDKQCLDQAKTDPPISGSGDLYFCNIIKNLLFTFFVTFLIVRLKIENHIVRNVVNGRKSVQFVGNVVK